MRDCTGRLARDVQCGVGTDAGCRASRPPACWLLTPLGSLVPIAQMMLDTVSGGDGVGLINLIMFAILTVFLISMMIGRDLTLLPILAVAGSLAAKQSVQESAGTLSTSTSTSTAPASSRASPRTAARSARCRSIRMALEQEGLDTCEVATAREARMYASGSKPVHLTRLEFRLLAALIRARGGVIAARQRPAEVWGIHDAERAHYGRVSMTNLRQKLEPTPLADGIAVRLPAGRSGNGRPGPAGIDRFPGHAAGCLRVEKAKIQRRVSCN